MTSRKSWTWGYAMPITTASSFANTRFISAGTCVSSMIPDPEISVVAPLRNESGNVKPLAAQIAAALEKIGRTFEIILVDDESADDTWAKVKQVCETDSRVKGIRHLRNGGQSAALCTGFRASRGRIIATLDGDLQNDPAEFPR